MGERDGGIGERLRQLADERDGGAGGVDGEDLRGLPARYRVAAADHVDATGDRDRRGVRQRLRQHPHLDDGPARRVVAEDRVADAGGGGAAGDDQAPADGGDRGVAHPEGQARGDRSGGARAPGDDRVKRRDAVVAADDVGPRPHHRDGDVGGARGQLAGVANRAAGRVEGDDVAVGGDVAAAEHVHLPAERRGLGVVLDLGQARRDRRTAAEGDDRGARATRGVDPAEQQHAPAGDRHGGVLHRRRQSGARDGVDADHGAGRGTGCAVGRAAGAGQHDRPDRDRHGEGERRERCAATAHGAAPALEPALEPAFLQRADRVARLRVGHAATVSGPVHEGDVLSALSHSA